jgi:hypothetical protein
MISFHLKPSIQDVQTPVSIRRGIIVFVRHWRAAHDRRRAPGKWLKQTKSGPDTTPEPAEVIGKLKRLKYVSVLANYSGINLAFLAAVRNVLLLSSASRTTSLRALAIVFHNFLFLLAKLRSLATFRLGAFFGTGLPIVSHLLHFVRYGP